MFKNYTKGLYKNVFGNEKYHPYAYGFSKGFETSAPDVKPIIIACVATVAAVISLVSGGAGLLLRS